MRLDRIGGHVLRATKVVHDGMGYCVRFLRLRVARRKLHFRGTFFRCVGGEVFCTL